MKQLKILGLVALAMTALLSFVGSAPATVLTSPAGTTYTGTVKAVLQEGIRVHNPLLEDECTSSSLEWKVESHGPAATVKGAITSLPVSECVEGTKISLLNRGSFEVHTSGWNPESDGAVTWTGAKMTSVTKFVHCVYGIQASSEMELTGSKGQLGESKTPLFHMKVAWALLDGSPFCSKKTEWTIRYRVTSPDYLDVD